MDFSQYLTALRARRKAFVTVFAAVMFTAILAALLVPKKYVASSTLLIDAKDEQTMAPGRMSERSRAGYTQTQVDLITSGRVAAQVARELKLAQKPGVRDAFEKEAGGSGAIEDWIGSQLLEKLRVDTSASNVLTIFFSSSDPKYAAQVANAFSKVYVETSLALRTEPSRAAAEWFEDQLKGMRGQISQAQTKLATYQKAKGITFTDERTDVEAARLSELSSQYLAAKNATYEAHSRFKQANEAAAGSTSPDAIPEVLASTYITGLKTDLQRVEARLETESTVLGENHPQYVRSKAEIQGLRDKIGAETKKFVAGLGNAVETARRREDDLKNAMAAQAERINSLKDARVELAVMSRDVEHAQRGYDAVLARYMTNKIDSAARSTNIALLTPALEPLVPAQPKVGLILFLAVLIGGMLAAAVVYVLETIDRRVRSRDDLESRLAVPSLGLLSKWQPTGGRLLPAPQLSGPRAARALPNPW